MYIYLLSLTALFFPLLTFAQQGYNIQSFIINLGIFLNTAVMPFIFAVAFFIFVFNVIRFFVIQGHNEDGRKNAKYLAIYSIGAFVFLLSFWGLVNILVRGVGLNIDPCDNDRTPDYFRTGAPCTSPRPAPRPQVQTTDNDSVSRSWLATGMGGDADQDPFPAIYQRDNDASVPGYTEPLADQEPFPSPGQRELLRRLEQQETVLRQASSDTLANLERSIGYYSEIIADWVFAPLLYEESQSFVTDKDKLSVAYAMWQLSGINQVEMNEYLNTTNQLRTLLGQDIITLEQLSSERGPSLLPVPFSEKIMDLRQDIRSSLESFNTLGSVQMLSPEEINRYAELLTDTRRPYEDRLATYDQLMGDNNTNSIYLRNPQNASMPNYDIEIDIIYSINAQKILSRDFKNLY